ncbi:MAG: DUF86 domain-containing protein [Salinivirgaceae bacterium]|nr:DUF86 domain-containing protein [Salinivirgaceae bacterium]
MRERARDKGRLEDIVEYSNNVTMLIDGYSFDELVADKRTYYSVIKNVEIVGEAAFMLTSDFKKSHPEIPWKVVQGMRHVLVHDYATIDPKELYNTAVNDMKPLRQQVEQIISETDWNEWASVLDNGDITDDSNLITIARRMKADGMSVELISKYTGLTAMKINSL